MTRFLIIFSQIQSCDVKSPTQIKEHVDASLFITKPCTGIPLVQVLSTYGLVPWSNKISNKNPQALYNNNQASQHNQSNARPSCYLKSPVLNKECIDTTLLHCLSQRPLFRKCTFQEKIFSALVQQSWYNSLRMKYNRLCEQECIYFAYIFMMGHFISCICKY